MALKSLFFVSLLTFTSLFADTSFADAEFRGEAKAKITFLEKQNVELKTKLDNLEDKQKSVEEYKDILNQQNSRISDISLYITSFGILIAIMTIGATIFGYFSVKSHAKEEARESAQTEINELKIEFNKIVKNAKEELEKIAEMHNDYVQQKALMKDKNLEEYSKTDGDKEGLKGAFQYALYQAEKNHSSQNWFDVAMLSSKLKDNNTLQYWDKVIDLAHNNIILKLDSMFNKGLFLGKLKLHSDAIDIYKKIIKINPKYLGAYINLFEQQLIKGEDFDKKLIEQFEEFEQKKSTFLLVFKMLQIVKNSLQEDQVLYIKKLKQDFLNIPFEDFGWEELDLFADKLQDIKIKGRVEKTIEIFKNWDKKA